MVIKTLKMMVSLVTSGTVILPSVAQEAASNKIEGNPNILLMYRLRILTGCFIKAFVWTTFMQIHPYLLQVGPGY